MHQEREDVAALVAPEAVVALAIGIDVERGGLLVVERAEADVVAARLLQRQVATDDLDNVDAVAD